MISGDWAATTGTVVSSADVGKGPGDFHSCPYTEATVKCNSSGAGSWTTPVLGGRVSAVSAQFVDFGAQVAITIADDLGATVASGNSPTSGGSRLTVASAAVNGALTISVATSASNNAKSVKIRIYMAPAGS